MKVNIEKAKAIFNFKVESTGKGVSKRYYHTTKERVASLMAQHPEIPKSTVAKILGIPRDSLLQWSKLWNEQRLHIDNAYSYRRTTKKRTPTYHSIERIIDAPEAQKHASKAVLVKALEKDPRITEEILKIITEIARGS